VSEVLSVFAVYVGEFEIRTSGGQVYVHIPRKLVDQLGTRKVIVEALINADRCEDKMLHNRRLIFLATLTPVGQTYRLKLPARYKGLAQLKDCARLNITIAPRIS
jgi:hypothetical protein